MTAYCDFSDLPRDSCAHCRQGLRVLPQVTDQDDRDWHGPAPGHGQHSAPLAPGPWFPARLHGRCSGSEDHQIAPGDMIRADGSGGWECENCG